LAVGMAAVAVVATAAGVTATKTTEWPRQRAAAPGPAAAQPGGDRTGNNLGVGCVVALPDSPDTVRIRVLDAGASAGVVDATATQLRERQFVVVGDTAGTTDPRDSHPAALRYGPLAIGAANLLRAELRGDTTMWFDPDRRDDTIDLALGATFTRLATVTEVNQSLVAAGEPTAPPQCSTPTSPTPSR